MAIKFLRKAVDLHMDNLQGKRRAFCRWYLERGNVREAALRAGCDPANAEEEGLAMLRMPSCRSYLSRLAAQPPLPLQSLVIAGLSRLAFGAANDAAKLVFAEKSLTDAQIEQLDLFHVTSIKQDKAGGIEIRLADRQQAMEKLLECACASDSAAAASALLSALGADREEVTQSCEPDLPAALLGQAEDCSDMVVQT
ncbi:MAG: terminase small subunit [Oscillospiraceae bacterium]|nr:terminase small subunit [Oscillospiraceae bacterium]